ncbi:MAG: hypothetical protein U9Q58_11655 [Pseudomonadota bacterium]|nr:hypothetical protein [Pseudomonadota bacterium]
MAKRKKKKRVYLNPDEVLSGKAAVSALELVRLIHKINPTEKNLKAGKNAEQYRQKAQLQSLLIKKFSGSLLVEQPDLKQPQLIGIRLKHFSEDACHTLLHELDEDAALWVRSQIDDIADRREEDRSRKLVTTVATDSQAETVLVKLKAGEKAEAEPEPEIKEEFSANELLKLGNRAFEEYDYEAAETFFYRAFIAAPDNLEIALNLFEFLLDHLAAYEKVVTYSANLSDRIKNCEPIRILRARSLARCGDIDSAIKCLGRTDHPDAAKVYLLGAQHFLQNGDAERAAQHVNLLQSFTEPELKLEADRLISDIHQLKIKNLAPLEKEMLAAKERKEDEKAAQLARKLLIAWPENEAAREIRHHFTKERKAFEKSELLRRADQAREREEFAFEIELLKKLTALSPNDKETGLRLLAAEAETEKREQTSKSNKILEFLDQGSEKEALESFAGVDKTLRQELIDRTGKAEFCQIELIISEQPNLKSAKIIEAILELGRCRKRLTGGDDGPQAILSRLQSHEKILRFLPEAGKLRRQAETLWQKEKSDQAKALLEQSITQLEKTKLSAARELIKLIIVEDLDDSGQKLYKKIFEQLKQADNLRQLKKSYADAESAEDHIKARDLAHRLSLEQLNESALWQEKEASHRNLLNVEWSFFECDVENLPRCYDLAAQKKGSTQCYSALLVDQDSLITVSSYGEWLMVGILSLTQQSYRKAILFRTPKELRYPGITLADDRLWINGSDGHLVELALNPNEIVSWHDFSGLLKDDNIVVEDVCLFPKAGYLWIGGRSLKRWGVDVCHIIRLDHHRSERQIRIPGLPIEVRKGNNFQVVVPSLTCDSTPQIAKIYSEQGRNLGSLSSLGVGKNVYVAATHPNGSGYVLLSHIDSQDEFGFDEEEDGECQLVMEILPENRGPQKSIIIENSHGEMSHGIFSLPDKGLVFVYCSDSSRQHCKNRDYQLLAFKFSGNRCDRLYQTNVPSKLFFVTDEANSKIVVLNFNLNLDHFQGKCVETVELGEKPPEFSPDAAADFIFGNDLPSFTEIQGCGEPTGSIKASALALVLSLQDASTVKIIAIIESCKMDENKNPDEIISLIQALKITSNFKFAYELEGWFRHKYPDHPQTLIHRATKAIEKNEWQDVVLCLAGLPITTIDDGSARHICHLSGIALCALGRSDEALTILEQGLTMENGDCELEPLIGYLKSTPVISGKELEPGSQDWHFPSLDLYQRVDEKLRNQEWFAVITIMENYNIAKLNDLQILARLSEAYLHYEISPKDVRWLGKVMVLAKFCDCSSQDNILRKNQLLPAWIKTWDHSRIEETIEKALHWLCEIG